MKDIDGVDQEDEDAIKKIKGRVNDSSVVGSMLTWLDEYIQSKPKNKVPEDIIQMVENIKEIDYYPNKIGAEKLLAFYQDVRTLDPLPRMVGEKQLLDSKKQIPHKKMVLRVLENKLTLDDIERAKNIVARLNNKYVKKVKIEKEAKDKGHEAAWSDRVNNAKNKNTTNGETLSKKNNEDKERSTEYLKKYFPELEIQDISKTMLKGVTQNDLESTISKWIKEIIENNQEPATTEEIDDLKKMIDSKIAKKMREEGKRYPFYCTVQDFKNDLKTFTNNVTTMEQIFLVLRTEKFLPFTQRAVFGKNIQAIDPKIAYSALRKLDPVLFKDVVQNFRIDLGRRIDGFGYEFSGYEKENDLLSRLSVRLAKESSLLKLRKIFYELKTSKENFISYQSDTDKYISPDIVEHMEKICTELEEMENQPANQHNISELLDKYSK